MESIACLTFRKPRKTKIDFLVFVLFMAASARLQTILTGFSSLREYLTFMDE